MILVDKPREKGVEIIFLRRSCEDAPERKRARMEMHDYQATIARRMY